MNKEALESNDLKLRQKVGELRSNLAHRQQTYKRKRKVRLGLKVGLPLLLMAAVGYYVTGNTMLTDQNSPPISHEHRPALAVAAQAPLLAATPSSLSTPPEPPAAEPPAFESSASTEVQAMTTPETLPPADVQVLADPSDVQTNPPPLLADTPEVRSNTPQEASTTAVVAATEPEPSLSTVPSLDGIRIAQSLTCLSVEDRQCVGARSVFALNTHRNPHVWMDVRAQVLPAVLKHVYYHNGRKYSEVTLDIKYPRMRTWSNVTLRYPTQVGNWRVEITTQDGTVLTQLSFRVIP